MKLLPAAILAAALLVLAAGLIWSHLRTWRRAQAQELEPEEHDYRRRQFRRRMQASAMIGIVGGCLVIGALIPEDKWPTAFVIFWFGVILLVLWIMLLAVGDIVSTRMFVAHMDRERIVEQAKLEAELRRAKATRSNGHPPGQKAKKKRDG